MRYPVTVNALPQPIWWNHYQLLRVSEDQKGQIAIFHDDSWPSRAAKVMAGALVVFYLESETMKPVEVNGNSFKQVLRRYRMFQRDPGACWCGLSTLFYEEYLDWYFCDGKEYVIPRLSLFLKALGPGASVEIREPWVPRPPLVHRCFGKIAARSA